MPRPAHRLAVAPFGALAACTVFRRALPLVVLALAFGLRLAGSVDRPLWFDEGYSIYFAGVSPIETARLTAVDIHPPVYYWALQLWTAIVGWNELSVRFFSVAVGTLTVALLLAVGRRGFDRATGWLAAGALALSPLHVAYSFEVRMYALVTLLVLAGTWLWWRLASRRSMALYAGVMAAALLTQYYAAFVFLGHALSMLWLRDRRRRIVALAFAGLPCALWAAYAGPKLIAYVQTKVAVEAYGPLSLPGFVTGFGSAAFGGGSLGALAATAATLLAVVGVARAPRSLPGLLASVVVAPLSLGYLTNLVYPFNPPGWERLLLVVVPPWLMLAAHGGLSLGRQAAARPLGLLASGAAATVVVSASIVGSSAVIERRPADDPRPMIRAIERLALPSDLYLAIYPWQVGYLRLYDRRPLPEVRLVPVEAWAADPEAMRRDLTTWADGRRVWLPAYQRLGRVLETRLERAFSDELFLIAAEWYGDHRLLFARPGKAGDQRARDVRFGDLHLVAAAVDPAPVESGAGAVPVELRWSGARDGAVVHLRLADARGVTWAQHDAAVSPPGALDRRAVLIPPATPPGRYQLLLSVSRGDTLLSADRAGSAPVPELDLGATEVIRPPSPPPLEALTMARPLRRVVAPGVELLGADFSTGPYHPGAVVLVSLYWLPAGGPPPEVTLRVGGASNRARPLLGLPGEPLREVREIVVRDHGRLPVILETPLGQWTLGEVEVLGRSQPAEPPAPALTVDARFGDAIRLLGATVVGPGGNVLQPGHLAREMDVELVWQATAPIDDDLAVFVHLVGPEGRPVAQHDSRPANGAAPTRGWLPGETIVDRHRLHVPTAAAGDYAIVVGLYRPPAGPRLLTERGDSVTIHWGALP